MQGQVRALAAAPQQGVTGGSPSGGATELAARNSCRYGLVGSLQMPQRISRADAGAGARTVLMRRNGRARHWVERAAAQGDRQTRVGARMHARGAGAHFRRRSSMTSIGYALAVGPYRSCGRGRSRHGARHRVPSPRVARRCRARVRRAQAHHAPTAPRGGRRATPRPRRARARARVPDAEAHTSAPAAGQAGVARTRRSRSSAVRFPARSTSRMASTMQPVVIIMGIFASPSRNYYCRQKFDRESLVP